MDNRDCTAFLQWALPQRDLRWPGFRKVRHQVYKRLKRRIRELGLDDLAAYRRRLEADPAEWRAFDECCHITISRFFRDQGVFEVLRERVLPDIATRVVHEKRAARIWSAGCASGEEPYTLKIIFDREVACSVSGAPASIVATDIDETVLARSLLCRAAIGDLQDIVRAIKARGASLKATEQPIDTSTAAGKCLLDMLGVFAEFETNLHREHHLEGIAKAKAAGVYKGRPSAFFFVPSCALTEWPSVRVASLRRFRPTSAGGGNAESPSRRERRAVARRASSQ